MNMDMDMNIDIDIDIDIEMDHSKVATIQRQGQHHQQRRCY